MQVFQTDAQGYLVGAAIAEESPREPGVFAIPAGCYTVTPPKTKDDERVRMVEGEWVAEKIVTPDPVKPTREQISMARRAAYANPVTGSDRFLNEAAAERLDGNEDAAKAAEAKCVERRAEIAASLPWPEGK